MNEVWANYLPNVDLRMEFKKYGVIKIGWKGAVSSTVAKSLPWDNQAAAKTIKSLL